VDVPSRARIFRAEGGRRLAMVTPIYNELSCSEAECHAHPPGQTVLGVLDVALDLSHVDAEVRTVKVRAVKAGGVHVLVLAVLVILFTRFFVEKPIRQLIRATREVSAMKLDRPVAVNDTGEIGELARSFDAMREKLQTIDAERNQLLESLEEKVAARTAELKTAHQRLMQTDRLASLGQLSASVAHEINNPLSGVLNLSMLMQRIRGEEGVPKGRVPEFRRYLGQVVHETSRVGRIVSDLLAFSRRGKPQRALADVNAVVASTVSLVSHKLKLMTVEGVLELAPDLPPVLCDGSQIQQVLLNLVMNGAEATRHKGRGTVWVRSRRGTRPQTILLEVQDTGDGIASEQMPKLFQPFYTTKDDVKGVGLGLAVVYGIVQAHGGEIEVTSVPGEGALFRVTLPVSDEARNGDDAAGTLARAS
jgi:two-component system NtrC family sensor kinase